MLRGLLRGGGASGAGTSTTLMSRMGITAIYRRPGTTQAGAGAPVFPYLLRGRDHAAEPGVGDGHHLHPDGARLSLSRGGDGLGQPPRAPWRMSVTINADFCIDAVEEAIAKYGCPRSSTPTKARNLPAPPSPACSRNGIAISMDGKGAWRDNIFVERLWRSIKYEEVYLHAYDSVSDARADRPLLHPLQHRRPHSSLADHADQAYFTPLPLRAAA